MGLWTNSCTYTVSRRACSPQDCLRNSPQSRTGQAWFPEGWTTRDIVRAGEYVVSLKSNADVPDGVTMWGTYKGVHVGVKKKGGRVATVFPDLDQPSGNKGKGKR